MLAKPIHASRGYYKRCTSWSLPPLPPLCRPVGTQPRRHLSLADFPATSAESSPIVVRSKSTNPYHNLAIEDYLLRTSVHSSHILFLYTNRPCVVLGRNQNPWLECNLRSIQDGLRPLADGQDGDSGQPIPIELVRRRSGGGAVFHDEGNLNYAVIVPNDTTFKRAKHAQMVVDALKNMTSYHFKAQIRVSERNDILMLRDGQDEWLKVSGSAFKLIRGRALHHGTLLYSSPYLDSISHLLRSPCRDLIYAKGVESVRSKVGNLLWTADLQQRLLLREAISHAIIQQFRALYGQGSTESTMLDVGYQDINIKVEDTPRMIRNGANEMASNEWRFGQTPKFEFHSGPIRWQGKEDEIVLHSNRGQLDQLTLCNAGNQNASVRDALGLALHTVEDWPRTLELVIAKAVSKERPTAVGINHAPWQNKALAQLLETTFPPWPAQSSNVQ